MHKELEYYLSHLLPVFHKAGIECTKQSEILYGVQLRLHKDKYASVLNIYYSAKKGISTVVGGTGNPLKKLLYTLIEGYDEPIEETFSFHNWTSWIGSDECGKGDYFGAPVVCAFAYDTTLEAEFKHLGIMDSKKLNEEQINFKARHLYKHHSPRISCIVLKPLKYNELIADFKGQHKNLNDLLAWLHSTAIFNLLKTSPTMQGVLVDQFSPSQKVRRTLFEKSCSTPCIERTGAEADPAVAAASIIARYQFVETFKAMRQFYQMEFPLGASSAVITSGKAFVQRYGLNRLGEVAKLHFKTTEQVTDS